MELLDDQVVGGAIICRMKTKFREEQVNPIHPEGEFVPQVCQIHLTQRGTIADDEGAFALVNILEPVEAPNAFAPPRMKVSSRKLRNSAKCVVRISRNLKHGSWEDRLKSLFH